MQNECGCSSMYAFIILIVGKALNGEKLLMMQDRVIGILDWELSTLGNQMSDVAYSCLVSEPAFPLYLLFYIVMQMLQYSA